MEKKMLANYNLLRILAIFLVISTHMLSGVWIADPASQSMAWHVREIIHTAALSCNGLFFMLSGRFILERFDGNIPAFYWKRFIKIGIPAICAGLLYYIQLHGFSLSISYFKDFLKAFLQIQIVGYLWFVMALAGFYLAAPFLSRMLNCLNKKELYWLLGGAVVYFLIQSLYGIFSMEPPMEAYIFTNWGFYCILGFLLDRMELTSRQIAGFLAAGLLGFILISVQEIWFTGQNPAVYTFDPSMIFLCIGIYLLVTRFGTAVSRHLEGPINTISRYIFFVYLFHGLTHNFIFDYLVEPGIPGYGAWLLWTLLSFFMALALSIPVYHLLYQPMCKLLLRK